MKLEPFWLATAPAFTAGMSGALPARADVVIVGGGFTGLSAALSLARKGVDVVLVEAGRIHGEASGRNGGHCSPGTSQTLPELIERYGLDVAKRHYQVYTDAVDFVEERVRAEQIDCDFERRGKLKLASKPTHVAGLQRNYDALKKHLSADVELLSAADVRNEIASDAFHGGMLDARGGQMHMGKFGTGLATAAARRGARIFEQAAVTRLTNLGGDRHRVSTAKGDIEADRVLLATGCSNHGPFDWWQRRIVPVGSFVIVTEPIPALLDKALPNRRNYVTSLNFGNYFRATADHRLVWGGRARFARSNPASDRRSGQILKSMLDQLIPSLRDVRIEYCWGGLVEATADRLPAAGKHDGLYYSMAYSGHGTQMSTYMGDVMADIVTGNPRANPWARTDWKSLPGYAGREWFLPVVGAYFRFKDAVS
ncbi:NAD(P)/FAD-dependent oxidoreductase [Paraburkholderia xenovorans]|uniref:NAD(P)/FAD-dependent oxidoreductase n=1 Tax=Paraburkholderia xenovorans TaxID=36873 RepID=UPI001558D2A6|nr:FAD-binding oxidoreductase [Paraburkholderia xenovorans]NPT33665.1 FAD-dependent oxidoreductase [Paraburkholderia xenovorans]